MKISVEIIDGKFSLVTNLNTSLIVSGEMAGSVYVAEIGGEVSGSLLDGEFILTTNMLLLKNFKGDSNISASLKPWSFYAGIHYSTMLNNEKLQCLINGSKERDSKTTKNAKTFNLWTTKVKSGV